MPIDQKLHHLSEWLKIEDTLSQQKYPENHSMGDPFIAIFCMVQIARVKKIQRLKVKIIL